MKPTALSRRLNAEQKIRLVQDARAMVEQYRSDMEMGFYPKRRKYEKAAEGDFSWRKKQEGDKADRIFDLSNYSLNITANVTRFMKARCGEDIYGSSPWFSARAIGQSAGTQDRPLADQINVHGTRKLAQAEYSRIGKEGIGLALDLGEVILKTSHRTDTDVYDTIKTVLVDKATGKPVVRRVLDENGDPTLNDEGKPKGEYIYPEDPTMDVPEAGKKVYADDPDILVSAATEFREMAIEERTVTYHGLDVQAVRFDDFVAPLNVPCLSQADCLAQRYQRRVSQLRADYFHKDPDCEELFRQLELEPEGAKSKAAEPRDSTHEAVSPVQRLQLNPPIQVHEVYLQGYDVFEDGVPRNVYLVLAGEYEEPLYCDYLANVLPRGKRPFHAIPVNRVPGRWYGRGFYEIYDEKSELIDALANAILYRNESNADPTIFWQPNATEEGKSERRFIKTPGKTYCLKPGMTAKDAAQAFEIPDLDQRTWEFMQLIIQLIQTDSGVTSAAQGDYSALPSASTATGVSSILQSASTLHRMLTEDLKAGFEPAVVFALMLLYSQQDKDETYLMLEGNAEAVLSLADAKTLAQLELNVDILLTRFHMKEQREASQLIITQVLPQWVQILQLSGLPTMDLAARSQTLFVQIAKGADVQGAEEIFAIPAPLPVAEPEVVPEETSGEAEAQGQIPTNVIPEAPAGVES